MARTDRMVGRLFMDCDHYALCDVVRDVVAMGARKWPERCVMPVRSFRVFETSSLHYHVVVQLRWRVPFSEALLYLKQSRTCDPNYIDWCGRRSMFSRRVSAKGGRTPREVFAGVVS